MNKNTYFGVPSILALAISATVNPATAQEQLIEEIITIGTRVEGRSAQDSAAPVDIVSGEEFMNQGDGDLGNLLRTAVPSYNVNTQSISDGATLVRPAALRGLSSDSTLVLVNGKRRHRGSVISFIGGGLSDGAQGPDVSTIPAIALKQVEVLRDGAAAQYGSDAIAGVINFQLRDAADGATIETKYATTSKGDGDQMLVAGNIGLPLSANGFANFSYEFREQDATDRSVQRGDAAELIAAGNTDVPRPAQVWGQPEVKDDVKFFANLGLDLGNNAQAYAFGNYASRSVDGGFYYRNPTNRPSVYADGDENPLIGNLNPGVANCDGMTHEQAQASADCFSFTEMFPGGFTPRFGGDVNEVAGVAGVRGEFNNGWGYDFSAGVGRHEVDFLIYNTVNASMGPDSPTRFNPGAYIQLEKNFNADFTKLLALGGTDVHFATGFEWREEQFEAKVGDQASWQAGPLTEQGFSIGSNGFAGFGPEVAGVFDRRNIALYTDVESEVTDNLLLGAALRWEDFSDFGSTTNYKLSGHWSLTDNFALRATHSTGFRAPTPGQSNITNVTTILEDGQLANRGTIPPTNPVALAFGGGQLQPETSKNFTLGMVANLGELDITLDFFNIDVKDRITQSSSVQLTPAQKAQLAEDGIPGADTLDSFSFYTNDFDTRTRGVDLVATYPLDLFGGSTQLSAAVNYTSTEVVKHNPETLDETRIRQLEDSLPNTRGNITLNHLQGDWRGLVRLNYFGSYYEAHADDGTLPITPGSEMTMDMELGYSFTQNLSVILGADNVFNSVPDENPWQDILGARYPVTSPMGFNGALYYLRARYEF